MKLYRAICILALATSTLMLAGCGNNTRKSASGSEPQRDTLRILAIGNSFSQDGIEQYLWELCDEAGVPAVIGNMYIGGCTLERHWNNAEGDIADYNYRKIVNGVKTDTPGFTLEKALADEPWDFVSFQQQSGRSGLYETYQPWLHSLTLFVRERTSPGCKFIWYQTWAYANDSDHGDFPFYDCSQQKMYEAIMDASRRAMADGIDVIIPCGTAIQNGRGTSLGDSFTRDGYHLNLTYGRYTAACAWFEVLTCKDVTAMTWQPEGVTPEVGALCRQAAHDACKNPFGE